MWAFYPAIFEELEKAVGEFFEKKVAAVPLKAECFLPIEVDGMIQKGLAGVKVLTSKDKWFGVTYQEDKPFVQEEIEKLKQDGVYPKRLWH